MKPLNAARRKPLALALILLLAGSACASPKPKPFIPHIAATDIVRQNAADALEAFFTKQDAPSLQAFQGRSATASTRQDLEQAWSSVAGLSAKGPDFLKMHVFDKAAAEARWPLAMPADQLETAFVIGVRQAVAAFLAEGGK